ncbi:amidohydrolase family protein [Sandaracinobacteroides saxicola]|uniref:Amidohydrolase family protein n=1 Tax=Sandaracinobacteroides saxicola TaxID=2759707 RepID=A0A7G5IIC1_9SPHN|nr:amidohydrolase family protein [Sandaracinobacteroides saxicola]QMW23113.1 amidohydrolase family protein [Sandaracinobacteroides saxicola]
MSLVRVSIATLAIALATPPVAAHGSHGALRPGLAKLTMAGDQDTPTSKTPAGAVPKEQLAVPPANAQRFTILSIAGPHGSAAIWRTADGTLISRESILLRGQVWEQDQTIRPGADGMPVSSTVRGYSPQGNSGETFTIANGQASWKSQIDAGSVAYSGPAYYATAGGTFSANADLAEKLLAAPNRTLKLLPGGEARATKLTEATVGSGASQKKIIAWAIEGFGLSPFPVWMNEDGSFFGIGGGFALLPVGYEGELRKLETAQDEALARRSPDIARTVGVKAPDAIAFTNVRTYDADKQRFLDAQTVVVTDGKISRVGPAAGFTPAQGTTLIDGSGKTLVPGLWDCHMHFGDDFSGPMLLSLGVTSVRDPGNSIPLTLARRDRAAKGELLTPKVYASVLIDGKGPNTAQVASVATTQAEADKIIEDAKRDGLIGVKFYGTFDPKLLKPSIAKAHSLGLHVHGHIPQGLRTQQALDAGYDEITHINWVMMQAMPDSIVTTSNGINRFEGPGRYAKDVDLNAEPMKSLIARMAKQKTTVDPTLVTFEGLYVPDNGDLSPAYAPFQGTMPPATERGFRQGGFAVPADLTRADYRRSFAKMQSLVFELYKAGVPIVAGTDGSGLEIVRELELYVAAGMTPAQALSTATIQPARLVGAAATTGSIAVGKAADLVLVDGDPSRNIGDLRRTKLILTQNRLMDADALRKASGFSGPPK